MCPPFGMDDNDDTTLKGGTDSTVIGNVGDRLKVDASFSSPPTVAEREYATFSVYAQSVALGNNKSMVSLVNTSGSTVKVRIKEIRIINTQTSALTGVNADFRLLRCVSHSSGTQITPEAHDTTDSLDSAVTARTGATIGTEGSAVLRRWMWSSDEWSFGAPDVESADHAMQNLWPAYDTASKTKPITLNADEGITIKQVTNSSNGTFDILVVFTQES